MKKLPRYHKRIIMDTWTVMPNHIHAIITLGNYDFDNGLSKNNADNIVDCDKNVDDCTNGIDCDCDKIVIRCADGIDCTIVEKIHEFSLQYALQSTEQQSIPSSLEPPDQQSIDAIKLYRKQRRKMLIPKILGKLQQQTSKHINILRCSPGIKNWQKDYHDHVIRNNDEYQRIKNYIINNPKKWGDDKFYKMDK